MKLNYRVLAVLALAIGALPSFANADLVTGITRSQHTHNTGTTESPFFASVVRQDTGSSFSWNAASGLSGTAVHGVSGNPASSSVVSGTLVYVGNSTFASGYTDGNGLAEGLSFSYDLEFTISGTPGAGEFFAVAGGNSGNGIGLLNSTTAFYSGIQPGQILNFSAATASNLQLSGSPTEAGIVISDFTLDDVSMDAFRSNSFNEAASGATLSNGLTSFGFGTSGAGIMNNNYSGSFAPFSLLDGPLTLTGDAGSLHLKGFQIRNDFTYDFSAVPEPSSFAMICVTGLLVLRRRRS